jgi:hypothetical protein
MIRVPHPVYSSDLSPSDFWFFASAAERMKDQIITNEDDLKNKLTKVLEIAIGDLLELVFYERMSRLEWGTEYKGEYYISPH